MEPILFASGRDDWETPDSLMAVLRREFLFGAEFGLDPCATAETKKGVEFYGPGSPLCEDGLSLPWFAETAFVNPPFGKDRDPKILSAWIEKCYREVADGHVRLVVALLPVRTDRKVWHDFVFPYSTEIRFLKGRVRFLKKGVRFTSATFPSAVVVWRAGMLGWGRSGPWDWRKECSG